MGRHLFAFRALGLGLVFVAAACCICCVAQAQDRIVAIVNNEIITLKDLEDFMNFMRLQLSQQYQGSELEKQVQSMKQDLLNRLIEDRIILQEAKKNDVRPNEDKVRARIQEIKSRYPSEKEFQSALAEQGLVQADLETRIREQLMTFAIVDQKVKSRVVINPSAVTEYFQSHPERFKLQPARELESVSTADAGLAREIMDSLKSGVPLEDLAKKHFLTVNHILAQRNGQLRKDVEDMVFQMKPGSFSGPINVNGTYYIFKLLSIVPAKEQTLAEVQDEIYAYLFDKQMQERLSEWLSELKSRSYINIVQE